MRPPSISDTDLVDALSGVFSAYGVSGATLGRLCDASGLKRASLYHRFPGGKAEMIAAVLDRTAEQFKEMLACAYNDDQPAERAAQVADAIRMYYDDGKRSCLIVALSIADGDEDKTGAVKCLDDWSDAFAKIAVDAGLSKRNAADVALDAVAAIEGSLVISATTGQTGPFDRALAALPARLTQHS